MYNLDSLLNNLFIVIKKYKEMLDNSSTLWHIQYIKSELD